MSFRPNATKTIVIVTVGVVLLPILLERLPGIRSRWRFAVAANAADFGNGDAQALLDLAIQGMQKPELDADYWNVKLKIAKKKGREKVIRVLEQAARIDSHRFGILAYFTANEFAREKDFIGAAKAMEIYVTVAQTNNRLALLNGLAYFRALANLDLQEALDIMDEVIAKDPHVWHYLDTRAWILHRLGLNEQALEDAQKAVQYADAELREYEESFFTKINNWVSGQTEPSRPEQDSVLLENEAEPRQWTTGVIHYHRGKILEALGQTEAAQADFKWLKDRRLPDDDRLH